MGRCWGYTRVSSQGQADHGNSLVANSQQIIRFCDYKGLDLGAPVTRAFGTFGQVETRERVICEEGVSGWSLAFAHRPAGAKLIAELRRGDTLVVSKLDRLGRNTRDILNAVEHIKALRVALYILDVSSDWPVNDAGAGGALLLTMLTGIAQFESDRKSERLREVFGARIAKGLNIPGHKTPLLKVVRGEKGLILVPDPRARTLHRATYELYAGLGLLWQEIAALYNAHGIKPPEADRWKNKNSVYRQVRIEHQLRQMAAELGLDELDPGLIYLWWERARSEPANERFKPGVRRGSLGPFARTCFRPSRDDRFLRKAFRRQESPKRLAQRAAAVALVQKLALALQGGDANPGTAQPSEPTLVRAGDAG